MGTYVGKDGKLHYSRKLLGTEDKGAPTPPGKPLDKTKTRDPNRTANKLLTGLIENGAQSVSNLGKRYVNNAMNELYSGRTSNTTYKTQAQKDAEHEAWKQGVIDREKNASAKIVAQYEKGLNKPAKTPAKTSTSKSTGKKNTINTSGRGASATITATYEDGHTTTSSSKNIPKRGTKEWNAYVAKQNMAERRRKAQSSK